MKKHENAIKMLMKNAIDTKTLYGYYESENGTRYLTNGHLIIKLFNTYSTVTTDYVGDLPRLNDTKFLNKLVDFVEAHKNGDYRIQLHMSNIKMWDKYSDASNCYKLEYDKNKYIGFSADYMKRLYTLTGDNCITIIDSKSPIYISGVGIECVFLPCWLDDNYNADNYKQFKEELKDCYIQDEADKAARKEKREAKKNTETMTEIKEGETINGFYAYLSGREYFLKTDNKRVTKKVIEHFIKAVGIVKGKNADTIEKMTTLKDNVDYTKGRIYKTTLKKNTIGNYTFIDIDGDNFSYGGNVDELKDKLYIFDFDALTPITFYQDEEKTNTTDIVADTETTETKTANNMSATATDKVATTDTANNDSVTDTKDMNTDLKTIETPVILRYSDYEHIRIKKGYYININNYDYIIYQKQVTNEYTIYNLNYMMPYGYDDFKTVADAVNHLNDTADKQNEYYNIHNHYTKQEIYNIYASYNFYNKYELVKQYVEKDMQADARQTETTQDKPHKTSKTAVSLFVVTDKPAPVKLHGANIPTLERIPTYTQRIISRFKPSKMQGVYNTRVSNKKPLKKAYNDFVGAVSCYNDKCAIGGKVAAGNTS